MSATQAYGDSLRSRAAFDLQCPRTELRVSELDMSTAGVEGCGQRGTYIFNHTANVWVLNSPGADKNLVDPDQPSSSPAGVPPGSPPGTLPGALPGTPPGSPPGTLPGAPAGSPPGTPPGAVHH